MSTAILAVQAYKNKAPAQVFSQPVSLAAGTADQEIVAAPGAGRRIIVLSGSVRSAGNAAAVTFRDGSAALTGALGTAAAGVGIDVGVLILPENTPLEATTTGTGTFEGVIAYAVV